jgi:hypothetical protein
MIQFLVLNMIYINLNAKIEKLNVCRASTSSVEHISICIRCRDVDIDAFVDNLAMIKSQNEHIVKLETKVVEHEIEYEKYKFARSILLSGRRPSIKDDVGFQTEAKKTPKLMPLERSFHSL